MYWRAHISSGRIKWVANLFNLQSGSDKPLAITVDENFICTCVHCTTKNSSSVVEHTWSFTIYSQKPNLSKDTSTSSTRSWFQEIANGLHISTQIIISVGNFGLPIKMFHLSRKFSSRPSQNCQLLHMFWSKFPKSW